MPQPADVGWGVMGLQTGQQTLQGFSVRRRWTDMRSCNETTRPISTYSTQPHRLSLRKAVLKQGLGMGVGANSERLRRPDTLKDHLHSQSLQLPVGRPLWSHLLVFTALCSPLPFGVGCAQWRTSNQQATKRSHPRWGYGDTVASVFRTLRALPNRSQVPRCVLL